MKTPKFLSNKYVKYSLLVLSGLFIGWIFFHSFETERTTKTDKHEHSEIEKAIWTCAMHPQIKIDKPGLCPICGMDLIPLKKVNSDIDVSAIAMSESAMKLADVQTSVVTKGSASREVQLYGKIQPNEKLLQSQTAHVPGRIEKLYINVTGEAINKEQRIASIYSPELISAQKELLEAVSMGDKYPAILESAREKLRNWKLSEKQIKNMETSSRVTTTFNIHANTSGIITNLKVNVGDYINKGAVMFDVVNLSSVWAVFDAYESDLQWISIGQQVEFTTQALPGKTFSGKVSFIDPIIDPTTRTARIRAEMKNTGMLLKPEYFINGTIKSALKNNDNQLIIPRSAVLWTGKRSVVYVKIPNAEHPTFKMREITLGAAMKDTYVVQDGLNEGEEIVTNGTFSIDAAAQLEGKPSMMNRADITKSETLMQGIDMSENSSKSEAKMIKVSGNCDLCKIRIEKAAKSISGVLVANWSPKSKMLKVQFVKAKTNSDVIQNAIAAVGHDTEKYKADVSVYNKLPECCSYRN